MKGLMCLLALSEALFAGCEDHDGIGPGSGHGTGIRIDQQIESVFRSQYPEAGYVEWDFERGYYVAEFWRNRAEAEAWYTPQGEWYMTETDVRYADLPQAVKLGFERSQYATWRIDDVDMLEYPDRPTVYLIEVESGRREAIVRTDAEGNLL